MPASIVPVEAGRMRAPVTCKPQTERTQRRDTAERYVSGAEILSRDVMEVSQGPGAGRPSRSVT